jgi:phage-related protein
MEIKVSLNVEEFIDSLEKETIAKVVRVVELLEEFGRGLSMPHSKKIDNEIYELRIRGSQEVRIFYAFQKTNIVLLHGFIKKSDKIPQREINTAINKLKQLTNI